MTSDAVARQLVDGLVLIERAIKRQTTVIQKVTAPPPADTGLQERYDDLLERAQATVEWLEGWTEVELRSQARRITEHALELLREKKGA